jgi:hypothetical protein
MADDAKKRRRHLFLGRSDLLRGDVLAQSMAQEASGLACETICRRYLGLETTSSLRVLLLDISPFWLSQGPPISRPPETKTETSATLTLGSKLTGRRRRRSLSVVFRRNTFPPLPGFSSRRGSGASAWDAGSNNGIG